MKKLSDDLAQLVEQWKEEAMFFNGSNDHPTDKAVGETYTKCGSALTKVLTEHQEEGQHANS